MLFFLTIDFVRNSAVMGFITAETRDWSPFLPTPFDLMVAPNGARLQKADHSALPITQAEIIETARRCEIAGATAIHVHVRDEAAQHSIEPNRYAELVAELVETTTMRIQISTEAADVFDVETQLTCLSSVTADEASVSLREISRSPELFAETYATAEQRGIEVQHILYSADEVTELLRKFDGGEIPEQNRRAIFVLGRYAKDQQSSVGDLTLFLRKMGADHLQWSVCAFGKSEQDCLLAALENGGHARIGFENNRMSPTGDVYESNEASVAAFVERAAKAGFSPARDAL